MKPYTKAQSSALVAEAKARQQTAVAVQEVQPAIMMVWKKLQKYAVVKLPQRAFSLISVSLVHAFKKGMDYEAAPPPRHKVLIALTPGQRKLRLKHGTPAEFARAVYDCVPGYISMDEAEAAVLKYRQEWATA